MACAHVQGLGPKAYAPAGFPRLLTSGSGRRPEWNMGRRAMDFVFVVIAILAVSLVVGLAMQAGSSVGKASALKTKFGQAGMLRGNSREEIIALVGPPRSLSAAPHGKAVLQWMETGAAGAYHVALLFDASGVCEGVTHEHDGTR